MRRPVTNGGLPETDVREYLDPEGRAFHFVLRRHDGAVGLAVHFSAFFGDWGEARAYRAIFQGYFHRLRMLGDAPAHNWLFVCDEYGADRNGTYYTGGRGDFFVERATAAIIEAAMAECGVPPSEVVTVGSSMGATGALKFGLTLGVRGIVAVSPHVDLDICAATQGRERHVAFIVPDGDTQSTGNHRYTRQIRALLGQWDRDRPLPRLFLQACRDDSGVYDEQVLPLCLTWRELQGAVDLDARPRGGHTSDFATRPLLLDAIGRLFSGEPIDVRSYQHGRRFRAKPVRPPAVRRVYVGLRTLGSKVKRRLAGASPERLRRGRS
jgi:hypothetical protein